ncbi:Chaperone protein DnaJ [Symbiodinium microadriaticum]|uniref:Chaperone protein DnaJ n=1 Tax=Symbiodinium microadriaticum TaxID=2951 RepID=A0A1Q9DUC5_SYMMI|nr:Chaperone protein DnaJ [Symbiodinium microadriaticum]
MRGMVRVLQEFMRFRHTPLHAGTLEVEDADLSAEDIRTAYRQAVRLEHPDTSELEDAEERFQRVRKAYAILSDEGSRVLLLEAIEQQAASFAELKGLDLDEDEEEGEERKSSFPWILLWVPGVFLVLGVLLVRLAGPDMQIRSASKEPMILDHEGGGGEI